MLIITTFGLINYLYRKEVTKVTKVLRVTKVTKVLRVVIKRDNCKV